MCIVSILMFVQAIGQDSLFLDASSGSDISNVLAEIEQRLDDLESSTQKNEGAFVNNLQFGLSFGFNYFTNAAPRYYVQGDSTLGTYGKTRGVSGMLSALLGYKVSDKHSILINIPLGDISGNPNQAIGIFNQRVAGGLGYGYNIDKLSIIGVINVYPYEEVALDVVDGKKYEQEPLTLLDTSNLPKQSNVSPSLTVGICYYLFKPRPTVPLNY